MSSEMWITYDSDRKKLRIPVLPEKIDGNFGTEDDSTYIYGKGEVTTAKKTSAYVFKFESFFPSKPCQGSVSNPVKPQDAVNFLRAVQNLDGCARFIYTGGPFPVVINCRISFTIKENGGDPDTIYYSLTIKEYREVKARQIKVKNHFKVAVLKQEQTGRATTQSTTRTYTVVSGDCLWNIAKKFYGDGTKYTTIYNANRSVIDKHGGGPNMIWPGDVLTIP